MNRRMSLLLVMSFTLITIKPKNIQKLTLRMKLRHPLTHFFVWQSSDDVAVYADDPVILF